MTESAAHCPKHPDFCFSFTESLAIFVGVAERMKRWCGLGTPTSKVKTVSRKGVTALMYHHIGPTYPGTHRNLTISADQFEHQMQQLARQGYVGISPADWLHRVRDGRELPNKPILLTFDDAYADTAQYALPILKRYGFSAAVFVVTRHIGGTNAWDEATGSGTLKLMSAEQIRHWASQGIEFGAHGRTHADLSKLSPDECANEIVGSKNDLATLLGLPVVSFAYPYGIYNKTICDLVRTQFDLAFSTEQGVNYLPSDMHLLRRAHVDPDDSPAEFWLNVRIGGINWRARLRIRSRLKKAVRILLPAHAQK